MLNDSITIFNEKHIIVQRVLSILNDNTTMFIDFRKELKHPTLSTFSNLPDAQLR